MEVSAGIGELSKEAETRSGNRIYEVEGARINLGWEKFSSKEPMPASADEAVVMLPGWGAKINTKPVTAMAQPFADHSHLPAYAVTAEAEPGVNDSLYKEAVAVLQFLQEKGIKKVTLAGHSQGGSRAIDLAVLLQEMQKVDPTVDLRGLILIDSLGLYEQDAGKMSKKFAIDSLIGTSLATTKDVLKYTHRRMKQGQSLRKAFAQSWQANQVPQTLDVGGDALSGMLKDAGQMINPKSGYWQRAGAQAKEMAAKNPRLSQVKVPVILIHGAGDTVIDRNQIIPPKVDEQVIKRRQEVVRSKQTGEKLLSQEDLREKSLKENVFTSSPYVKMVIAREAGRHGLPLFRDVARASLGLLERARREM